MKTIDMHTHFVPLGLEAFAAPGAWPWVADGGDGTGRIMKGDKVFRHVTDPVWRVESRLADMAAHGIDVQVISATPVLFSYWAPAGEAAEFAARVNGAAREMCAAAPGRLESLAQVPLQDVALACRAVEQAMADGHRGVQIGNHAGDMDLDSPEGLEFLTCCAAAGAAVFVHGYEPMGGARMGLPMLPQIVGVTSEGALTIVRLILSGAFERLPGTLRLAFAHGGGTFPFLLARAENTWARRPALHEACPRPPSDYMGRFMVDSLVFSQANFQLLLETAGADNIMMGSDYPYLAGEEAPGAVVRACATLGETEKARILAGNAGRWLGLDA